MGSVNIFCEFCAGADLAQTRQKADKGEILMASVFEMIMMICFGVSWPLSVYKSYKARTAKGKSILFLFAIWIGYICGIVGKFISGQVNYVLIFYFINISIVSVDIILYFRNRRLDRAAA